MKKIIGKAANAAIVLFCHFVLASLLIISFHFIERLIEYLGPGTPMTVLDSGIASKVEMVFGVFPLSYLFQAVDVAMIALFGFMGVKEAYEVLK